MRAVPAPADRAAAEALGPVVAVAATVSGGVATGVLGRCAVDHRDGSVEMLLRPEQIVPARLGGRDAARDLVGVGVRSGTHTDQAAESGETELVGHAGGSAGTMTVLAVEFQGHDVLVDLVAGDVAVRARWPAASEPAPGDVVAVAIAGVPLLVGPA